MEIRDAVEGDAPSLAAIANAPVDVMRNLVHDRSVRVAVGDGTETDPNADVAGRETGVDDEDGVVLGFVSFDAREQTVHVTQLDGTGSACTRLLSEPVRFARGEGMNVELLVPIGADHVASAAEELGFDRDGTGPSFDGTPTIRYRLEQ